MAECPEVLGLKVLFEGPNSSVDIVAVHGLGSTPDWAWIWSDHDKNVRVNWLENKTLLPAKLPNSRIMTFNYELKWLLGAPKQRRSECGLQLLPALDSKRKQEKNTEYRPLIFIGHSFGGVVIEESLAHANGDVNFQYLASSIVGIIFLGTPHRGTHAAKWGEIVATSAKALGLGFEDSILKDLQKDSESLRDLFYKFTLWANRTRLSIVCFYEQHKSDYLKRYQTLKTLVVDEISACIDGYPKVPLATDHFKINKYKDQDDLSYIAVSTKLVGMAEGAVQVVRDRLEPQKIVENDLGMEALEVLFGHRLAKITGIPDRGNLECLHSLFLSDPRNNLAEIYSAKEDRSTAALALWRTRNWKDKISSFLVEELKRLVERSPRITLAYYFCDDKDERRKTATAILRGLLLQLLRQKPKLFRHIQPDFDIEGHSLVTDFHSLWRIFVNMIKDLDAGEVYCLIDALDECEENSRRLFLTNIKKLFCSPQQSERIPVKFIVTSRPKNDIEGSLSAVSPAIQNLQVDSGRVNNDLSKFIDVKVNELWKQKNSL